jgi:deazaflavin-dependent oxidoreductase (nitroreductase family)
MRAAPAVPPVTGTWQRARRRPPESGVAAMADWNSKIIEEFRANEGKVGGPFEGAPLLLLHTVGARTGQQRVNPMMYRPVPGGYAVFASKSGAPTNPDWYHNLLAHPDVAAEIGTETVKLQARVAEGTERGQIWEAHKAANPGFAEYEKMTTRQIPVVILEPAG